jgi:hypothetical protein
LLWSIVVKVQFFSCRFVACRSIPPFVSKEVFGFVVIFVYFSCVDTEGTDWMS